MSLVAMHGDFSVPLAAMRRGSIDQLCAFLDGDLAQMVERSLSMREALGSMPRFSSFVFVRVFLGISASPEITFTTVCSYSSVGQSVRLITVRSAVQARVGALFLITKLLQVNAVHNWIWLFSRFY